MAETDERWRDTVIHAGGDAYVSREPSLSTTIARHLRELALEGTARTDVRHVDDEGCSVDTKHGSISTEKMKPELEPKQGTSCNEELKCAEEKVLELKSKPKKNWNEWEKKVVRVLNIVRRWEITEFDPKLEWFVPTRLYAFNIAFFDLDIESKAGLGPPILSLNSPDDYLQLETSVNVISVNVVESDVGYPISIFGTVLARDQNDYRCVYLFRRGRDDPQIITSPEDMLTLTGPKRGLGATDYMFFEFNLKIKGDDGVDKDFSKGVTAYNAVCQSKKLKTSLLRSWLSIVKFVFMPVEYAVEATVAVKILEGTSSFTGRVTAWTTGNDEYEIVLYDSEVAGTNTKIGADGSVELTRCLVVVPLKEELMLNISVMEGDHEAQCFEFVLGHYDEDVTNKQGPYKVQVKIIWTALDRWRRRRPNMWEYIGGIRVLM